VFGIGLVVTQGVTEQGAGISPVAVGCALADTHDFGRFGARKACEDTETHEFGPSGVLASQRLQSFVDRQQVVAGRIVHHGIEVNPDTTPTFAPLLAAAIASPVHQDPAHGLGRRGEEVGSPVPRFTWLVTDQPQLRFVDQACGFKRLPGFVVSHFLCCQLAQFIVDQRQEFAGSAGVSLVDATRIRVTSDIAGSSFRLPDRLVVAGTRCALIRSGKDVRHDDLADLYALDHNGNVLSLEKVDAR
jgi:hypothetical protein